MLETLRTALERDDNPGLLGERCAAADVVALHRRVTRLPPGPPPPAAQPDWPAIPWPPF